MERSDGRRGIPIYAQAAAPPWWPSTTAASSRIGHSERLGRFVQLQDVYGNTYTYADLGKVDETYPAPKAGRTSASARSPASSSSRATRSPPAPPPRRTDRGTPARRPARAAAARKPARGPPSARRRPPRSACSPTPPGRARQRRRRPSSSADSANDAGESRGNYTERPPASKGARVTGGDASSGTLGRRAEGEPETRRTCCFEIRPAGRGAPRIDPKPILDGWKLLESTAVYRAANRNPFFGPDAETRRSARSC